MTTIVSNEVAITSTYYSLLYDNLSERHGLHIGAGEEPVCGGDRPEPQHDRREGNLQLRASGLHHRRRGGGRHARGLTIDLGVALVSIFPRLGHSSGGRKHELEKNTICGNKSLSRFRAINRDS